MNPNSPFLTARAVPPAGGFRFWKVCCTISSLLMIDIVGLVAQEPPLASPAAPLAKVEAVPALEPAPAPAAAAIAPAPALSPQPVMEPTPEPRRVRQPVHEYFTVFDPQSTGRQKIEGKINPFVAYTHLGTDFGFIGTGQEGIGWEVGTVSITMPQGVWAGMWHSLEGLGADLDQTLDLAACYPPFISAKFQPRIVGLELRAKGKGTLKVELKSGHQHTLWAKSLPVDSPDMRTFVEELDAAKIGRVKYLNWVAEPGANAVLDSVAFIVEAPALAFDEYVFLASYAKLARCFSLRTAYVRDRAHIRDGYFDNVPACGLFALSTALACKQGMVSEKFARDLVRRIEDNVSRLDTAQGLLPHFVKLFENGRYGILPGTEYSSVDTAIYYHAMLLAAEVLRDEVATERVTDSIKQISFGETMVDSEGYIRHGVREDRTTPLRSVWRDWGGESALVLAFAGMTDHSPPPRMASTGRVYDGTGFIAEIASLFYPDFDDPTPDAVTKQDWLAARKSLLTRQKEYFPKHSPDSAAAQHGFYGLSAGEARHGLGYMVGGVDLPSQSVIHPHYVLMSAGLVEKPADVYAVLRKMEEHQLLPPWGMAENFSMEVSSYLPMLSSLNASFECLGAYHLMAKNRGMKDEIHEASRRSRELRKGAAVFYPVTATSFADSKIGKSISVR